MTLILHPEFLQTRRYSAQQMRHLFARGGLQEGAYGSGDGRVSQRAAGANMSVDVAAGDLFVQGDDVARQGLYHLVNDGVVNVPVPAAHGTLPRLNQLVARARDSTVIGVSDAPAFEVVQGAATAGATLDNGLGRAVLPNGALLLADMLLRAGATDVLTGDIRDRRRWARGIKYSEMTSTPLVIMTVSMTALGGIYRAGVECSGKPLSVELAFGGYRSMNTSGMDGRIEVFEDGVSKGHLFRTTRSPDSIAAPTATMDSAVLGPMEWVPSPGWHLIELRGIVSTGTMTLASPLTFRISEDLRESATNG